jgi:adenosylcobyric acid synthase
MGTYIHGLVHNAGFRRAVLLELARRKGVSLTPAAEGVAMDREYDKLADWVRASLKMDLIYQIAGLTRDFDGAGASR